MINKVVLIGNAGGDPEVKVLDSGMKVVRVGLATTERTKNTDGTVTTRTEWHSVTFWQKLAEIAEKYIRKGSQIYVEGSIHYHKYTDKNNIERSFTDISAREFKLLGKREEVVTQPVQNQIQQPSAAPFGGTTTPGYTPQQPAQQAQSFYAQRPQPQPQPQQSLQQRTVESDDLPF